MTSGVGVLVGALALLGASGLLFAALLRLGSVTAVLLGAYAIAWVELTVVTIALSVPRDLTRTTCLLGFAACAVVALAWWLAAGRPPLLSIPLIGQLVRDVLRDPLLVVLAGGVLLALTYIAVLGITTPQIDADSVAYHLPRAAFWKQQHAVAYIGGPVDSRENANPPVAEIGVLLTMLAARSDKFVWLPQFASLLACGLAVFGIGRRLRLEPRQAMLGALLFLSLPVSLLQAATSLSDVLVASFVLVAMYFTMGTARRELGLAGASLALAMATKVSAVFALPFLVVLVLRAQPRSRWRAIGLAGPCVVVLGAGWYVLNRIETGSFAGGLFFARHGGVPGVPTGFYHRLLTLRRLVSPGALGLDTVEVPGAVGWDALFYGFAAVLVAAGLGLVAWRRRSRRGLQIAGLAGVLALAPVALPGVSYVVLHSWQKMWWLVDRRNIASIDPARKITVASPNYSWFGPLGFLLGVVAIGLVVGELRRRGNGRFGALFALAPFAWLLIVGWAIGYAEFDGRYFIVPFGMAAACWGVLLRFRAVAAASVAVAMTTMLLVLVHFERKPSGLQLLAPIRGAAVWDRSRGFEQTGPGDEARIVDFVNRSVPADAVVALPEKSEFLAYPFFGPEVGRTILFGIEASEKRADTIVFAHGPPHVSCSTCWRVAVQYPSGWGVLRRTS